MHLNNCPSCGKPAVGEITYRIFKTPGIKYTSRISLECGFCGYTVESIKYYGEPRAKAIERVNEAWNLESNRRN